MSDRANPNDGFPKLNNNLKAKLDPPGPVEPQTFELGLVLGGTVSAGAYTAGALDLLVEALDAFQGPHKVKLRLAAGSSGGAVCAAILGMSLNRKFTHVRGTQATLDPVGAGPTDNKFWDLWVNLLTIMPMLKTDDLVAEIHDPPSPSGSGRPAVQHVPALLNGKVIGDAVANVVAYANEGGDISRSWAAAPFRVATTVCNLRGIPYRVADAPPIGPFTGTAYVEHDDYAWFALPNVVGKGDGDVDSRRPNEFYLSVKPQPGISFPFQALADYARASGAMPIGLPSRPLQRPVEHYIYRPYGRIDDQGKVQTVWPLPDWVELPDALVAPYAYSFTGVDGGTLNNDPVKIAHEALTGIGRRNPQHSSEANRALLLIDPLADQPTTVDPVGLSLVAAAKALVDTFKVGSRYLTADLDLFQDDDVFSRFQLVPTRTDLQWNAFDGDLAPRDGQNNPSVGAAALAGTDLFALGGWCARQFRVHDFLLGRLNMAAYLRRALILSADNHLFDRWPLDLKNDYCMQKNGDRLATEVTDDTDRSSYYLPIIPMPPDSFGVVVPSWPNGAFDPSELRAPLKARAKAVLDRLRADNLPGIAGWFGEFLLLGNVTDAITDSIVDGLTKTWRDRKLWPRNPDPPAAAPHPQPR